MREPRRRPWLSVFRIAVVVPFVVAFAAAWLLSPWLDPLVETTRRIPGLHVPNWAVFIVFILTAWLMRCPRCGASVLMKLAGDKYDWLAPTCTRCGLSFQSHAYWTRPFHSQDKRES